MQAEFNPFQIFNREVARKFLIQPRDRSNYTESQLEEMIPHRLRIFKINNETWFLAKDVCAFLGITPDISGRKVSSIESNYVRREDVRLKIMTAQEAVCDISTRVYKMYLVNEPGIYALIQKSRTTYAQEFKRWLNEEVLPTIRTQGSYTLPSLESVEETNAELESKEYEASCKSREEVEEEFKGIIEEKDKIIEEQKVVINRKDEQHGELISILTNLQGSMSRMENKLTRLESHNENLTKTINTIRDVVVKDRIAAPSDDGKGNVFVIISTHENDMKTDRYPYVTIKCQKKYLAMNLKKKKAEYPNSEVAFQLPNPSADKLFDCLKEKVKARELPVSFYHSSFRFFGDCNINQIIEIVNEIERERVRID